MHHRETSRGPAPEIASRLPVVVVTSVIRSAYKGQSHGGVYLLDLDSGDHDLMLDWDDEDIDWAGRGGDRGLRGVAFHGDRVYLAASDEVFVYDRAFRRLGSISNRYLRHCHEIDIDGDALLLTSCGFDTVLRYDLAQERFTEGFCARPAPSARRLHGVARRVSPDLADRRLLPAPRLTVFDPEAPGGPEPADTLHINSVRGIGGEVYFAGRRLDRLYVVRDGRLEIHGVVPLATHNAQPFRDGLLLNHTDADAIWFTDLEGDVRSSFVVPSFRDEDLENVELARGRARAGFGRGLTVWDDDFVIAGSSPATVAVHHLPTSSTLCTVTLTRDVRNAVHGLEVWPWGRG